MDAATETLILFQIKHLLDAEVIHENRKCRMGWRLPPIIHHHKPPLDERPKMSSITGAASLAGTIKDRINAAKAKVAQVSANTDIALGKLNDAAETGNRIAKQIEQEADDLLAQIGQFTNGGPE